MSNKTQSKAQLIIKAEPCGVNRTLYLDKVYKYDSPAMPEQLHTHDNLRTMAGLPKASIIVFPKTRKSN